MGHRGRPPTTSREAASGSPTSARPPRGATCARRCRRSRTTPPRCGSSPPTTTSARSTGSRSHRRASRSCARLQDVVGSQDPVLLDWLVGLAFPCQRPFSHQNGVIEVPKWRILPDRFGAEANSPVMDYLGGGPLGITELLVRATTVPTYLKRRLVPRLGRAAAAHAVLPQRRTGTPGSRFGDAQRAVEPGAAASTRYVAYHRASCPRR